MPIVFLNKNLVFPPVHQAENDGLLAIGGDLSTERLLVAYRSGIFPWFSGTIPQWFSPDPRCVLFPSELKISQSMKQLLKKNVFDFTIDWAFEEVIENCSTSPRNGQNGTWITDDMKAAY